MLSITAARGEYFFRSVALWGTGTAAWLRGDNSRAQELLRESLRLNRHMRSPLIAGMRSGSAGQIASRLVISQRTAAGHIEHIPTKLGFTSRAQIAAWIVDADRHES